jgi:hypothetical protein
MARPERLRVTITLEAVAADCHRALGRSHLRFRRRLDEERGDPAGGLGRNVIHGASGRGRRDPDRRRIRRTVPLTFAQAAQTARVSVNVTLAFARLFCAAGRRSFRLSRVRSHRSQTLSGDRFKGTSAM